MKTIEIDYANENVNLNDVDAVTASMYSLLKDYKLPGLKPVLKTINGPAGYPVFHISGEESNLNDFVEKYTDGEETIDVFLI